MKLYGIRNEAVSKDKDLAFLFYYESHQRFYIEIPTDVDPWELPIILSNYVEKGIYTLDGEKSASWVQSRVVPTDRQNLGMILRDNRLKYYDTMRMLVISDGKCAQDDCFITTSSYDMLPIDIKKRMEKKVADVMSLSDSEKYSVVVFFADDTARKLNLLPLFKDKNIFLNMIKDPDLINEVKVSPGGFGIEWDANRFIMAETIYESGEPLHISYSAIKRFVKNRTLTATEIADSLDISRQYVNRLVKENRIIPAKVSESGNLFLRADIEK